MRVSEALGRWGEQVAADALVAAGLTVLVRNWRCPEGEVDILALDGQVLVVCEVKTRSSAAFGRPEEAVTPVKAARLRRLALRWLSEHPGPRDVRFDVVSVTRGDGRGRPVVVDHLRAAF